MKAEIRSEEPLDVTAPGALPFIDFEISEFDELVAATEQIQSLGHSVVRTPAGPLVIVMTTLGRFFVTPIGSLSFRE